MSNANGADGPMLVRLLAKTRDSSVRTKPRRRNNFLSVPSGGDSTTDGRSLSPGRPRRSPMFTFKLMEARSSAASTSHQDHQETEDFRERQDEVMTQLRHAVKRTMVFNAHRRTSMSARRASTKAEMVLDGAEVEINECNRSRLSFYDANRRIGEAAVDVAKNHNIELEYVDSDEDKFEQLLHLSSIKDNQHSA